MSCLGDQVLHVEPTSKGNQHSTQLASQMYLLNTEVHRPKELPISFGGTFPSPPRTYYLGTGALKGPLRAYYLSTWGARDYLWQYLKYGTMIMLPTIKAPTVTPPEDPEVPASNTPAAPILHPACSPHVSKSKAANRGAPRLYRWYLITLGPRYINKQIYDIYIYIYTCSYIYIYMAYFGLFGASGKDRQSSEAIRGLARTLRRPPKLRKF